MTAHGGAPAPGDEAASAGQRIDKWLWCARLIKTRSLAAALAASGAMRITRRGQTARIEKASLVVRPGDQIAFLSGDRPRIYEIAACGLRRGPAAEARALYQDLSPPPPPADSAPPTRPGVRDKGAGRPTKKERRAIDRLASDA